MPYNIDAIRKKIADLGKIKSKKDRKNEEKLQYFKPQLGPVELRVLPYDDGNGQPIQQIDYYDSRKLTQRRVVAPKQWGLPDPVYDLYNELSKDRSSDTTWNLMKELKVKESYYVPVLVRGKENEGVKIWELNNVVLNQIYSLLAHPDFCDEDLFHPKTGYDFILTCTDSGKKIQFNGKQHVVKNYDIKTRRKPSPIASSQAEIDAIVASIPNLNEYFKKYVMSEEKLRVVVSNYLSGGELDSDETGSESSLERTQDEDDNLTKDATSKIDAAFSDLDD